MSLPAHATTEGTTRYRKRFAETAAPDHFRTRQDLTLSSIGIGTYLGNANAATDQNYSDAIVRALQLGCNVIDSAANYRFQRSERAIGAALQRLTTDLGFSREEIVICTKGGYLPFDGAPPRNIQSYVEETFVRSGIATFDDFVGGSHCMTPRYLQNQLDQSLANMGLKSIDVYYIHNPEAQVGAVSETEFYQGLGAAFELLEENYRQGKLQHYGVASWNGFRVTADSKGYHSLQEMVELARQIGGNSHHFRFIQLPFNLAMPEALTLQNQVVENRLLSLLDAAASLGLTVVASASIFQGRLTNNLPDELRHALGDLPTNAQMALQFVRSTPKITTALVGMSHLEHVEENLTLTKVPPIEESKYASLFS